MPRDMVHNRLLSALALAMVTAAPNRVSVSVMHVVSISSLPLAIGTKTDLDILRDDGVEADVEAGCRKCCVLVLLRVARQLTKAACVGKREAVANERSEMIVAVNDLNCIPSGFLSISGLFSLYENLLQ